jgi:hypothetical protein
MRLLIAISALVLATLGQIDPVSARPTYGVIGAGCAPHGDSVGLYTSGSMGTYFANGQTGTIRLFCPVTTFEGGTTWRSFSIAYKDPDGMSTAYRVRVLLYTIPGLSFTGRTLIQTCDSNTSNNTGYTSLFCDFTDFTMSEHDWYWFEVIIDRTSTASMPEFGGIKVVEYD